MHPSPVPALLIAMLAPLHAQERPALRERTHGLTVVESDAEDLDLRMTPVVRAVQKAADSVVSIYINHAVNLSGRRDGSQAITEGQGSGVILDGTGAVITNWHVIQPVLDRAAYSLVVKLKDGRQRGARVISSSPAHDLALLQLQAENDETFKPIEIGRSSQSMIGETVLAIGNPAGHANTVTSGVLSASGRSINARGPDGAVRDYTGLLQTDAAINPGNSGGALLDITGRLIGINNAMAMGAENIGFAIPVDTVREVFEKELLSSIGLSASIWLGLDIGASKDQLVVQSVFAGGPAAQAGVRVGDQVVTVSGRPVDSLLDYSRRVLASTPRQEFRMRLRRDGRELEASLRPMLRTTGEILAYAGLEVEEVTTEQDAELLRRATKAYYSGSRYRRVPLLPAVLRVGAVQSDGPAAALDVRVDDVLLAIELTGPLGRQDVPLDSARVLADSLRRASGRSLKLVVLRGDEDLSGTLEVRNPNQR